MGKSGYSRFSSCHCNLLLQKQRNFLWAVRTTFYVFFYLMESDIEVVLKWIAECQGNISKARVAKLFGWSAGYFHQGFKKKAGVSFRAKRFQIKMEIAARLLTSTSMTVEQIAANLGYSERANFERPFKRAYGVTPTQFKKFVSSDWCEATPHMLFGGCDWVE